ncbi:MAG: Flp pilus assembly protein CpaB [Deltaproteobacteria bacterium]
MDKKKISVILGVLLAVFAVIGARTYIASLEKKYVREEKKAYVFIATVQIPAGTVIDETMIKPVAIPEKYVQPTAVDSQSMITGKRAVATIYPNEQIMASKLTITVKNTTLAMRTPQGKRAMTITINPLDAVGAQIRPGDYVDVVGIFPYNAQVDGKTVTEPVSVTLFQNILVLSMEGGAGVAAPPRRGEQPAPAPSTLIITLALSPKEAAMLTYALSQGSLRLILRPPLETVIEPVPPVEANAMWQYVFSNLREEFMSSQQETPQPARRREPEKRPEPPPSPTVEIYRGTEKSNMVLTK